MSSDQKIHIRALEHSEWKNLRNVRLEAVTNHPNYFLSNPEQTKALSEKDWKRRIESNASRIFGLYNPSLKQCQLIGITGIFIPPEQQNTACLVMSYIKPEYRGNGYSSMFFDARFDWALSNNTLEILKVCHREGNHPSQHAITKHGFKFIGKEQIEWPDGTIDTEYQYELNLTALRNPHRMV